MHLYSGRLKGESEPHAEIEEIAWMTRDDIEERQPAMTPLTLEHVLPFLAAESIWS